MSLTHLNVHHVRNIAQAQLALHPRFNVFCGANGSGKTSLLEAIYLLGTGHSFRTRETASLIRQGESALTVFARTHMQDSISIQKSLTSHTTVKINQQPCNRSSELAYFLPCQSFYQDIFHIIDEGPAVRRGLLDWGLFHVKQSYLAIWKDYRRVIKQRNALLRQKASAQQCEPWNHLLVNLASQLDVMRAEYFYDWSAAFQSIVAQLTDTPCTIRYYKGWDKKNTGKDLATILKEQFVSDTQAQYTHSGAHHADIIFETTSLHPRQSLSRGQQKIILIACKLAQAQLLSKPCVYLFDDIAAELDAHHLQRFIACLRQIKGQFFLTAIDASAFRPLIAEEDARYFLIEKGCFT